jgi:Tfp pilus assembly protein PilV
MVELLLVALVLGVGLLGLCVLQVATVRGLAGTWTRLAAATLAHNALAGVLAEAGPVRPGQARPAAPKYTAPGPGPWVERFDRNGRPTQDPSAFFTVTVTRSVPDPLVPVWAFQAAVVWAEGAPGASGRISLTRLVCR